MTKELKPAAQIAKSLSELEEVLESPLVPGETYAWLERVHRGISELRILYSRQVQSAHRQQFDEIVEQDADQLARIEQLQEEDSRIQEDMDRLSGAFRLLIEKVAAVEHSKQSDEALVTPQLSELTEEALALIIRIRKLELALETWFVEAFQRDQGVAD